MPTLDERVTRLEADMEELRKQRAGQESGALDISGEPPVRGDFLQALSASQTHHAATLNRHTAMHREHHHSLAWLTLNVGEVKDGVQQIIGMLDMLIERGDPPR